MRPEARLQIREIELELVLHYVQRGQWYCDEGVNAGTFSEAARKEIEAYFRDLGYEVRREKRLSSGKRLRGLWIRRPPAMP